MQPEFKNLSVIDRVEIVEDLYSRGLSSKQIKSEFGLDRYELSHLRRISKRLTENTRRLLKKNDLSEGHARALARLAGRRQEEMLASALQYNWSVRTLEGRIRGELNGREPAPDDTYYNQLAERISEAIGHPVQLTPSKTLQGSGEIKITYLGLDAFDSIMDRLRVKFDNA